MNDAPDKIYDICVIGGGINGTGIARDAAGRGLSVLLCEKGDLAQATSSSSTKLIHGGLRYLEQYEFKLVAESLTERERLLRAAPHIIWPMQFILPHEPHLRPKWMIRLGLFLYDRLGKRKILPKSKSVSLINGAFGHKLQDTYTHGFSYADCWVEDSRLVVLNAMDARARGADIHTRTACTSLSVHDGLWRIKLTDEIDGDERTITARTVVNAGGPWVRSLLDDNNLADQYTPHIRMSKGSHIILPKLYDGDHAYILQQPDERIVFAIPYEGQYTLIGTTDEDYTGDPLEARISDDEMAYLCEATNRSFKTSISKNDVLWTYSGVRPLLDSGNANPSEVTRDYKLDIDHNHGAPLLSLYGGKLTTYRAVGEHVIDELSKYFDHIKPAWTKKSILPGGDIFEHDFDGFIKVQTSRYKWLDAVSYTHLTLPTTPYV